MVCYLAVTSLGRWFLSDSVQKVFSDSLMSLKRFVQPIKRLQKCEIEKVNHRRILWFIPLGENNSLLVNCQDDPLPLM